MADFSPKLTSRDPEMGYSVFMTSEGGQVALKSRKKRGLEGQ